MTDKPTLEQCHAAGMTKAEAARAMGVHRSHVGRWAKKAGLTFKRGRNKIDMQRLLECHAAGMTVSETAQAMGVSKQIVYRQAKRAGFVFPRTRKPKVDLERLLECHAAGMTKAETARAIGVTDAAVIYYARKKGLSFERGRKPRFFRQLTEQERADYHLVKAKMGYTPAEALAAIKRHDLIEGEPYENA